MRPRALESLPAAHRRHDHYFYSVRHWRFLVSGQANNLSIDKDVDVLADLALLVNNSVLQCRMKSPESKQQAADVAGAILHRDHVPAVGKAGKVRRNSDGDRHYLARVFRFAPFAPFRVPGFVFALADFALPDFAFALFLPALFVARCP